MRYAFLLLILIVFFTQGCGKEKDIRREIAENSCKYLIRNPNVSAETKKRAEQVLGNWSNNSIDREPVIIRARWGKRSESYCLSLDMSDEDFDVSGIIVREIHPDSGFKDIIIEEKYPVFPSGIGHHQIIKVAKRNSPSQRKNNDLWNEYANSEASILDVKYTRKEYPDILISMSEGNAVKVQISIYDFKGNVSEAIPLEITKQAK